MKLRFPALTFLFATSASLFAMNAFGSPVNNVNNYQHVAFEDVIAARLQGSMPLDLIFQSDGKFIGAVNALYTSEPLLIKFIKTHRGIVADKKALEDKESFNALMNKSGIDETDIISKDAKYTIVHLQFDEKEWGTCISCDRRINLIRSEINDKKTEFYLDTIYVHNRSSQ